MRFIQQNFDLTSYNTFNICAKALYYFEPHSIEDIFNFFEIDLPQFEKHENRKLKLMVLAGGSNVLFANDFDGVVIRPLIKGIEIIDENAQQVWIEASAGENWDELVEWCVNSEYFGLENLSYIPGTVGASPIQNIGAYGVEVMERIDEVEFFSLSERKIIKLKNEACRFDYRNSIFKQELKNDFILTAVRFCLDKQLTANIKYAELQAEFGNKTEINAKELRAFIIALRKQKLPEPSEIGNAGSFFKNPIISRVQFELLQLDYPTIPQYIIDSEFTKVPAAWLIDQCGLKGCRIGAVGVHDKQALVLVNHGNAKGKELLNLAQIIQQKVVAKFNVKIEMEVNVVV